MKLIKLTQGKFAMVDDLDYIWLKKIKWHAKKNKNRFYAVNGYPRIYMHRLILGLSSDDERMPDHKDRNGLNNQRSNLRIATRTQNLQNSGARGASKYKGVSWDGTKKWHKARICVNGKIMNLGNFKNEADAAMAYNKAAKEHHGEFAYLNIIETDSPVEHLQAI